VRVAAAPGLSPPCRRRYAGQDGGDADGGSGGTAGKAWEKNGPWLLLAPAGLLFFAVPFLEVTLPLSTPGILAGSLLVFALSISAYVTPIVIGGYEIQTLPVLIYQQVSGEVEQVFQGLSRTEALAAAERIACERAVEAGANAATLLLVDHEDLPIAYLPGGRCVVGAISA
jgi:hypothetical protein